MRPIWIVTTLCLLLITACSPKKGEPPRIRPVVVETVELTKKRPPLSFSGFSKSEKSINVSFRVPGLIDKLPIKVGEQLEVGQLLAKLDAQDYQLKLEEEQAALESALAEGRKASAQYQRIKTLYESESASRDELDQARAAHEGAIAAIEKNEALVEQAQKELSYTTIYVERRHCEVSTKDAEINENVKAGQTIATLSCGTRLEIEVAVSESSISSIYEGQEVEVIFNVLPDYPLKGKVTEVGVTAAKATAYPVTIALQEENSNIRSGMAVRVMFPLSDDVKPRMIVSLEGVGEDQQGNFVYIFEATEGDQGIAKLRRVTVGEITPLGIEITSGLKAGDQVIVAGLRYLTDGRKVKLLKYQTVPEKKL